MASVLFRRRKTKETTKEPDGKHQKLRWRTKGTTYNNNRRQELEGTIDGHRRDGPAAGEIQDVQPLKTEWPMLMMSSCSFG